MPEKKPRTAIVLIHTDLEKYKQNLEKQITNNDCGLDKFEPGVVGRGSENNVIQLTDIFPAFLTVKSLMANVNHLKHNLPDGYIEARSKISYTEPYALDNHGRLNSEYAPFSTVEKGFACYTPDPAICEAINAKVNPFLNAKNSASHLDIDNKVIIPVNINLKGDYNSLLAEKLLQPDNANGKGKQFYPGGLIEDTGLNQVASLTTFYSPSNGLPIEKILVYWAGDEDGTKHTQI
jgi:hypothetical protein